MAAVYDRNPDKRRAAGNAARPRPVADGPPRRDRPPGRRPRAGADVDERARPAGAAPRSRPASTCWSRSRWRRRCPRPPNWSSWPRARPATWCCAPHILLSPTYRAMQGAGRGRRDRHGLSRPRPLRLGRAPTGPPGSTAGRRCAVRPRRLQRRPRCAALRPGAARDGDDRRRDPASATSRREMQVEAEDNAHVLIDFGDEPLRRRHDRLHDAAVPLARASSCTAPTACCRCSATTGRRRATSCGATAHGAWEIHGETDPDLAVDGRPAPPGASASPTAATR